MIDLKNKMKLFRMQLPALLLLLCIFILTSKIQAADKILKLNAKKSQLVYGDVLMSIRQKFIQQLPKNIRMAVLAADSGSNRWPGSVVPYELSEVYSDEEKAVVRRTFDELESISCFRFVEKTDEHEDYLFIDKQEGCYSYKFFNTSTIHLTVLHVGKQGGRQLFSLGEGCLSSNVIKHEVLHALGAHHEHQRPGKDYVAIEFSQFIDLDRDNYIQILYENVEESGAAQFETVPVDDVLLDGFEYDYLSIMHYTNKAFGKVNENGEQQITMVPKQEDVEITAGEKLSEQDIHRLNVLGSCN